MRIIAAIGALIALASGAALHAQTLRPMLDLRTAETIRDTCLEWAGARDLHIAIAIYDEAGRLITFSMMDGASSAVADIAMWKGKSAATIHVASKETANWGQGAPGVATWEGGVPFFMQDGTALGGVGVSGADSADDTACGVTGIEAAGLVAQPG